MINFTLEKKNKLFQRLVLFIFFSCLLIIGSSIFHVYGVSLDEEETRRLGFMTLKYIYEVFYPLKVATIDNIITIPKLSEFFSNDHGAILDTLFAYIEITFDIKKTKDIFFFRHYLCFIIFFISVYFFYLIGKFRFNDWRIGILGSIFLVLSPRIFAESFYNNKDIIFMSLFIISLYFCLKFIYKPSIKHAIFFSLTSALAIDMRLMGIILPSLVLLFFLFLSLKKKNFLKDNIFIIFIFLILLPSFIVLFWPYLWPDPITNFFIAFKKFSSFPWEGKHLYFGTYVDATHPPWHYPLLWIGITTPFIYIFLFIVGFYINSARVIKRLVSIEDNKKEFIIFWAGKKEMIDLMIILNFFLPIFLVIILNSTLHDGWRHLYFTYPSFLLISLYGYEKIIRKFRKSNLKKYFLTFLVLVLITNLINMIRIHPYQNVYFNFFVGKNVEEKFEVDYWGLSNKQALEFILSNDSKKIYKIYPASNMNLNTSKLIFSEIQKNKILVVDNKSEADYIISNGRFWYGNIDAEFAKIPEDFKLFKEIRTDRAKVVSIFRKRF